MSEGKRERVSKLINRHHTAHQPTVLKLSTTAYLVAVFLNLDQHLHHLRAHQKAVECKGTERLGKVVLRRFGHTGHRRRGAWLWGREFEVFEYFRLVQVSVLCVEDDPIDRTVKMVDGRRKEERDEQYVCVCLCVCMSV